MEQNKLIKGMSGTEQAIKVEKQIRYVQNLYSKRLQNVVLKYYYVGKISFEALALCKNKKVNALSETLEYIKRR